MAEEVGEASHEIYSINIKHYNFPADRAHHLALQV
jgi:hypothetical protein